MKQPPLFNCKTNRKLRSTIAPQLSFCFTKRLGPHVLLTHPRPAFRFPFDQWLFERAIIYSNEQSSILAQDNNRTRPEPSKIRGPKVTSGRRMRTPKRLCVACCPEAHWPGVDVPWAKMATVPYDSQHEEIKTKPARRDAMARVFTLSQNDYGKQTRWAQAPNENPSVQSKSYPYAILSKKNQNFIWQPRYQCVLRRQKNRTIKNRKIDFT